jgi:hypothetical protein
MCRHGQRMTSDGLCGEVHTSTRNSTSCLLAPWKAQAKQAAALCVIADRGTALEFDHAHPEHLPVADLDIVFADEIETPVVADAEQ